MSNSQQNEYQNHLENNSISDKETTSDEFQLNSNALTDDAENVSTGNSSYTAKDMEHLSDQEHVRVRPAMYIGDTGSRGLHHLVTEVVDNSIDEVLAGFADTISVIINSDGSITVEDNGRGIPVEEHPDLKKSTLEGVMTVLKFGG